MHWASRCGVCIGSLLVLASWVAAGPTTLEEQEEFLRTGKIVRIRELSQGITNSQRATLSKDGFTHDAHVQTIDEFKTVFQGTRGVELNFRDSYRYNIAAYLLNKVLRLGMVPPSVERRVDGRTAAVTWWVDDVLMTELERFQKKVEVPDPDTWNSQMYIVRVFDQLIYNVDRNLGNLVITRDWKLRMIDHTRAFRIQKTLKSPDDLIRCDRELLARLRALDQETLRKAIPKHWLSDAEIRALLARGDRIVEHFADLIRDKGEAEVLYDYLSRE